MHSICVTCGTQFAESRVPPDRCPICDEPRQYLPPTGQRWTTLEALRRTHRNCFQRLEPRLLGIGMAPEFGIGQRALFVESEGGNVLWDCVSLIDQATIDLLGGLGGVSAIAVSHPHYYTSMIDWSHAFGNVPVYIHVADREWVQRPDPVVEFWSGPRKSINPGATLVHCGGHFAGGTVMHWADGAEGRGALLTGDILQVAADRASVSFMYSYPNMIPLSRGRVESVVSALEPFRYDRIYGAFWDRHIEFDAQAAVTRSLRRYVAAIEGGYPPEGAD
jgi:hypothetical protein